LLAFHDIDADPAIGQAQFLKRDQNLEYVRRLTAIDIDHGRAPRRRTSLRAGLLSREVWQKSLGLANGKYIFTL
jgi:hypothetical protein